MADKWEKRHHLNTHRNDARRDPDRDGLNNLGEFRAHTDPHDADTDNDGIKDGAEDRDHDGLDNADEQHTANNPNDRDTDNDGIEDGDELAGTIVSFNQANGQLVIDIGNNRTASGTVNSATRIECENENEAEDQNDDDHVTAADHGDENENEDNCTTDDLQPGTAVHQAELNGTGADAVFEEIELVR
jgi:hypothetical protein